VSENANIRQRPWYFNRVYADTEAIDTVYIMNVQFQKSIDGGRTFNVVGGSHGDHHDLWLNPHNAKIQINGNDGGATVTQDGGATWTDEDQPTAQFYRVATDNDFPYNIYGAQQDNSTVRIASRSGGNAVAANASSPSVPEVVAASQMCAPGPSRSRYERPASASSSTAPRPQRIAAAASRELNGRADNAPPQSEIHSGRPPCFADVQE